nr:MAG TPA: hypothetical protein [Bacteriophage sp.]
MPPLTAPSAKGRRVAELPQRGELCLEEYSKWSVL